MTDDEVLNLALRMARPNGFIPTEPTAEALRTPEFAHAFWIEVTSFSNAGGFNGWHDFHSELREAPDPLLIIRRFLDKDLLNLIAHALDDPTDPKS